MKNQPNGQNAIVPVRMSPELKSHCRIAAEQDGFESLAGWIKHVCKKRIGELQKEKPFKIRLKDLPY